MRGRKGNLRTCEDVKRESLRGGIGNATASSRIAILGAAALWGKLCRSFPLNPSASSAEPTVRWNNLARQTCGPRRRCRGFLAPPQTASRILCGSEVHSG